MKILTDIGRCNPILWTSLNILRLVGYFVPDDLTKFQRKIRPLYFLLWFMLTSGFLIIIQIGDLVQIWGNIPLMAETSYFMMIHVIYVTQIINMLFYTGTVYDIVKQLDEEIDMVETDEEKSTIKSFHRDTVKQAGPLSLFYAAGSILTWSVPDMSEKQLLFRAWYPFDVTKSPAYELAYLQQNLSTVMIALTNACFNMVFIFIVAMCRCRIKLLEILLKNIFRDIKNDGKRLLTKHENNKVSDRLKFCIIKHQTILNSASKLRQCFKYPILSQFTVSITVICISTYQIGKIDWTDMCRLVFTISYVGGVVVQIYIYCYQGESISRESMEIADTVYGMPWYVCSLPIRKSMLIMMVRSRRPIELTAGGFADLTLACFMSIMKVSYSFFTVLQQVDE